MDCPSEVQEQSESQPEQENELDALNRIFEEEKTKRDDKEEKAKRDDTLRICCVESLYNVMEPPKSLSTHTTEEEETDNPNEIPF